MSDDAEWLGSLQVGDLVIVESTHIGGIKHLETIGRLTATQIILDNTTARYRRTDGYRIGPYAYHRSWIEKPTPEARAEIKHQEIVDQLKAIRWKELSLEILERVAELVKQAGKAER